jgi:hypothetical protein
LGNLVTEPKVPRRRVAERPVRRIDLDVAAPQLPLDLRKIFAHANRVQAALAKRVLGRGTAP